MSEDWIAKVRPKYQLDFEDWIDTETQGDEVWVYSIPEPLQNGQDMSPYWFLKSAQECLDEGDKRFADLYFRKAAQRGSWLAMLELADMRYELGHLEECMRWNQRLIACLLDYAGREDELLPPISKEDWREELDRANANVSILASEGISVELNNPKDIGESRDYMARQFTYCLKCGSWKIGTAPVEQCDDSVHMTTRNFG